MSGGSAFRDPEKGRGRTWEKGGQMEDNQRPVLFDQEIGTNSKLG